jgi:hypothetical protein
MRSCARSLRALTYRFSGAISKSSFPGIEAGDRFFGRVRFDPSARQIAHETAETRFADPDGFVDAMIGAFEVRSAGALEIQVIEAPSVMRLSLAARRGAPGDGLVGAGGILFLSGVPMRPGGLPTALSTTAFVNRSFAIESPSYDGFAEGRLHTLYPLTDELATAGNGRLTTDLLR